MSLKEAVNVQNSLKKPFVLLWWPERFFFFDAVLSGPLFKLSENSRIISKSNTKKILGQNFYEELSEIRKLLQLDDSLISFFKKCALVNEFLGKKYFWGFTKEGTSLDIK